MVDLEDNVEVECDMDSGEEEESIVGEDSGDDVEESNENEVESEDEEESDEVESGSEEEVESDENEVASGEEDGEESDNEVDSGEQESVDDEAESGEEEAVEDEVGSGEDEESVEDEAKTEEANNSDTEQEAISGWADSMLNILKSTKPKNKKNLILSRARKDYEINKNVSAKPQTKGTLEIARDEKSSGTDGKTEEEGDLEKDTEDSHILSLKKQRKLELRQRKLERAWENLNRLTNEQPDKELETDLVKVATKGVVQLFNAVATQQKTVKTKLRASRKSEFKKEKVLSQSKDYFESAMNKSKGKDNDDSDSDEDMEIKEESSSDEDVKVKPEKNKYKRKLATGNDKEIPSKRPVWQALQDDFMLSAKLKDWDKESDSD